METLTLCHLSFSYPNAREKALEDVCLSLEDGEFCVLCGPSGSGKSTLLRQLKTDLTPRGTRTGEVLFYGAELSEIDRRTQCGRIGFVGQSPEDQIVTDKVWHELAFGLESLGEDTLAIRRRVSEMASFFGMQTWFDRDTASLSGGQKQLLNLASVMVTQPSLLVLDEPTSQLDPIAAAEFLSMLGRLNREFGTTILLSEHRLEEAFPLAGSVAVLDAGRLVFRGTPREVGRALKRLGHPMFLAMPTAMRVWAAVSGGEDVPVTVGEGRAWLEKYGAEHSLLPVPAAAEHPCGDVALRAEELWFRYEKNAPDVVQNLSVTVRKGEFLALLGGNGTGKTTALRLMAGLLRPYRGRVKSAGRVALLPQSPQALFVKKTVEEDLKDVRGGGADFRRVVELCGLGHLLECHPYDLSGGEQQRAALAKVLLTKPDILLLDEPTKGLDPEFKRMLGETLETLCRQGKTVVVVSHDIEFCAGYAHRCGLFFAGDIVAADAPRAFFRGNSFYTTAANRMGRTLAPEAVTAKDLIAVCGGAPEAYVSGPGEGKAPAETGDMPEQTRAKPGWRAVLASALLLLLIPATVWCGARWSGGRYTAVSLLVLLEAMLPFFLCFESRRPQARELAVIAGLCAVAVAGRAALFMLPQCKPVLAVAIIAGAALGGETGFLVGAVSMLASNMLFAQGPWTPWQMFAAGIIGFLGGKLFSVRRGRGAMALFGAAASVVIYGGLLNTASALLWADTPTWPLLLSYYVAGLPMDCVQGVATALFLWFAAGPMLEKLDRLKGKYRLME